jgi:hypothetical protein
MIIDIKDTFNFWADCMNHISDHIASTYGYEVRNHLSRLIGAVGRQSSPVYHNILNNVQQ